MSTPTKCYVVTTGIYSDYEIKAIFLDRTQAESYHADLVKTVEEPNDIQEWEFGRPDDNVPRECWAVYISLYSGEEITGNAFHETIMASPNLRSGEAYIVMHNGYSFAESFVSRDHALKLAVEKRQGWLRKRDLKLAQARAEEEAVYQGKSGVEFEELVK